MRRMSFVIGLFFAGAVCMSPPVFAASAVETKASPMTLDGIIDANNDDTLAFTPDGNTVFFDRSKGPQKTIMVSHRVGGRWSQPGIAGFSGKWFDQDPLVAPDGTYLLFDSCSNYFLRSNICSIARVNLRRHVGCFPVMESAHGREAVRHRDAPEDGR